MIISKYEFHNPGLAVGFWKVSCTAAQRLSLCIGFSQEWRCEGKRMALYGMMQYSNRLTQMSEIVWVS